MLVNDTIFLSGSGTDDGQIVEYAWKLGINPWVVTSTGDTAIIVPSTPQTYVCSLRVTDNEGLTAFDMIIITVLAPPDTVPPILILIGKERDTIFVYEPYYDSGATAWDEVDGDLTDSIVVKDSVNNTIPGSYHIHYEVSDKAGNRSKKTRFIVVVDFIDTIPPVLTLLGKKEDSIYVYETYFDSGATAWDEVDGDLTDSIVVTDSVNNTVPGRHPIHYEVSDKAGNKTRDTRYIWVLEKIDVVPPVITLLGKERDSIYIYETYYDSGATAWDEVDGDLTDSIRVTDSLDNTTAGIYPIHYEVSDKAGNAAKKTRYIWIFPIPDTIPPVITLLGDSLMTLGVGANFKDPGATAIDNVDGDISNRIRDTGSVNVQMIGVYYIYYNVSDAAGNQAEEKRRTVNVVDTVPPDIYINPPNPVNLYVGTPYYEWGATAYDNLDGDITHKIDTVGYVNANTNDSVNVSQIGTYRVHYRVTDNAGYTTDSIRIVNVADVADTTKPIITLQGDNPMSLEVNDTYNEPGAMAIDNKDGDITDSIEINNDSVNTSSEGVYRVHYDVSDEAGNNAHEVRTVYVGSSGGDSIVIGTGNTTSESLPVEAYYQYTYSQSIYTRNDLNAGNSISIDSIAYYYSGSSWSDAVRVYMGHTNKNSFSSTTDWISSGDLTQVFNGNYQVGQPDGWKKIKLSTPFQYNNSDNLVIAVDENTPGYHEQNDQFFCTNLGSNRSLVFFSDDTDPDPSNPPTSTGNNEFLLRKNYCPNIKIYYH